MTGYATFPAETVTPSCQFVTRDTEWARRLARQAQTAVSSGHLGYAVIVASR